MAELGKCDMDLTELTKLATLELERFLNTQLPTLGSNWWQSRVFDRLTFQQQRFVEERRQSELKDLDLAALLRVVDQNWPDLADRCSFPKEGRSWLKELQSVRNKWAHQSGRDATAEDHYRDVDTLWRVLQMLDASRATLDRIEGRRAEVAAKLAVLKSPCQESTASRTTAEAPPQAPAAQPTSGQTASASAAKSRALFAAGNLVTLRSNPAIVMPILEIIEGSTGEPSYRVFHNNSVATFYESQLQPTIPTTPTSTQLTAEAVNAALTSLHLLSPSTAHLFSLRSGRIDFDPYQYRPVLKLIRADRPRLLIADEVGVGKTIEAGLMIKELQARMDLKSVLIICPKSLVSERKWDIEMKRFGETFTTIDGPLLRHCIEETHLDAEWPEQYAKAILPFSLLDGDVLFGVEAKGKSKRRGLLTLDPPPKFDLVIVDEAHHIRNSSTYAHEAVRFFCDNAEAVVLLTATPIQLGRSDLFTLLSVLRPDLVIDLPSFNQMAEPNQYFTQAARHCRKAEDGWNEAARDGLTLAASTAWGRRFISETPTFQSIHDQLGQEALPDADRVRLIRSIEDLYTFNGIISRTRRRDIGEFTVREPQTLHVEFTESQRELHDALLGIVAKILAQKHGDQNLKFMMATIRRQAASCLYGLVPLLEDMLLGKLNQVEVMEAAETDTEVEVAPQFVDQTLTEITDLIHRAKQLDAHDLKAEAFIKALLDKQQLPNNKALVFSTFRHTLRYLAAKVEAAGLRFGLVHGDVDEDERRELRRRFKLAPEDPDALEILLSSEVGCEGLDFQFCDFMVNYDLPWNPMRIEQRIGRIDRRGQKSPKVVIVNLVTPGTVDAEIYDRCLLRIGVFEHTIGGCEEILGGITQELQSIEDSFALKPEQLAAKIRQLSDNAIQRVEEDQALESKQAELFGLNVPKQDWLRDIESAENYWLSPGALQHCVTQYLATRLGRDQEFLLGKEPLKTLRLSQEARNKLLDDYKQLARSKDPVARDWEKWLKGSTPTLAVTFDQVTAAEHPQALHLSVTHPLLRQAAQHLKFDTIAYTTLEVQSSEVAPGEYRFGIYRWSKHGVKTDEELIVIASDPVLETHLFALLKSAKTRVNASPLTPQDFDSLDAKHHSQWSAARANHEAENRQFVEYRIQSLTVSHNARCKAIEDQLAAAKDSKIRQMKQAQLDRAHADFNRRLDQLNQAANSGDIHATAILLGTIEARPPR